MSIFPPEEDYTGSTYYVLWSGDKGCEGGSGTMSSYISEVSRYSSSRPFLVNTDDALGDNNEKSWTNGTSFTNYRFIESIKNKNLINEKLNIRVDDLIESKNMLEDKIKKLKSNKIKNNYEKNYSFFNNICNLYCEFFTNRFNI